MIGAGQKSDADQVHQREKHHERDGNADAFCRQEAGTVHQPAPLGFEVVDGNLGFDGPDCHRL